MVELSGTSILLLAVDCFSARQWGATNPQDLMRPTESSDLALPRQLQPRFKFSASRPVLIILHGLRVMLEIST